MGIDHAYIKRAQDTRRELAGEVGQPVPATRSTTVQCRSENSTILMRQCEGYLSIPKVTIQRYLKYHFKHVVLCVLESRNRRLKLPMGLPIAWQVRFVG